MNQPLCRVLLIEANNQRQWIGSRVAPEVHIPPLGLLYLAAVARRARPELEIQLVESSLDVPTDDALNGVLDELQPDVVAIRGVSVFRDELARIARLAKAWGDTLVVAGGPIATTGVKKLLEEIEALDLVAVGEGEITFTRILSGEDPEKIPGLVRRQGTEIVSTGAAEVYQDLDKIPFPDYTLIDLDRYKGQLSYTYNHRRQGVMLTSRGCPYQCTYCNTFAGKRVRLRSADNVYEEMLALHQHHFVSDFYFIDDVFNISRRRIRKLFQRIIDGGHRWRLYFVNGMRADLLSRELVDQMVAAGTVWVTYGVESASERIQQMIKKNLDLELSREIIRYTQEKGIVVNIDTMYGFPTETPAEAEGTLDFLGELRMGSVVPYHFCLRVFEGCEIVEQAQAAGWDLETYLSDNALSYNDLPTGTPSFSRQQMLDHVISYHERFGTDNRGHLERSLQVLSRIGYSDQDLLDMYTVLLNVEVLSLDEILNRASC